MISTFTITIFTFIPKFYLSFLTSSLLGKSLKKNIWNIKVINIRDFSIDSIHNIDSTIFGGGPGMLMRVDVINNFLKSFFPYKKPKKIIYFSPRGIKVKQRYIQKLAKLDNIGLLCGKFEGIDQRIFDFWNIEEISLGDFILSGGDVAAAALIESIVRLLPGVLGNKFSLEEESFSSGLLEYDNYTRPKNWRGSFVPNILISGDHSKISVWKNVKSKYITRFKRPDLWEGYLKSKL